MILLVLLGLLGLQDASWPELPPGLKENPQIVQAYQALAEDGDEEARRGAAQTLLDQLRHADVEAQAGFVLGLEGSGHFPLDLGPTMRRIQAEWPPFSALVEEGLRAGVDADAPEADLRHASGCLRAARALALSAPARVEAVAACLAVPSLAEEARRALRVITRREFRNLEQFQAWWSEARDQGRAAWLDSALDQASGEVLALWERLIAADPARAADALTSDRVEVRRLGLQSLDAVPEDYRTEEGRSPGEVLAAALAVETDPDLRIRLIREIPRFLRNGEAFHVLGTLVLDEYEVSATRVAAAKAIARIRPTEEAFDQLLRVLEAVYAGSPPLTTSAELRIALLEGLTTLARVDTELVARLEAERAAAAADASAAPPEGGAEGSEEAAPEGGESAEGSAPSPAAADRLNRLDHVLQLARVFESANSPVCKELNAATAEFGTPRVFLSMLRAAFWAEGLRVDQKQSLIQAYGRLAGRGGNRDEALSFLGGLLESGEAPVRYSAAGALGRLASPRATALLIDRLGAEDSESMQERLLMQSRFASAPEVLPRLLAFRPSGERLRKVYRDTLDKQLNGDAAARLAAVEQMLDRGDAEMAWYLQRRLPEPAEDADAEFVRRQRVAQARSIALHTLLGEEAIVFEDQAVQDALARLAERRQAEPVIALWPRLQGELLDRAGRPTDAFEAYAAALPNMNPGQTFDRLAVRALVLAEELERDADGLALAAELPALGNPEQQAAFDAVRGRLQPQAGEEEGGVIAENGGAEAQASPAPAEPGGEQPQTGGGAPAEAGQGGGTTEPDGEDDSGDDGDAQAEDGDAQGEGQADGDQPGDQPVSPQAAGGGARA